MRRTVVKYLHIFFTWLERNVTPRRYATKQAIAASRRASRSVPDVRSGPGGRAAVKQITKFNNANKGSNFLKRNQYNNVSNR